jgi:hypothetical protein
MAKRIQPAQNDDTLVYIGPNIISVGLQQFAVYREGIPAFIQPKVAECPDLKEMFVPISQLNSARRALSRQGSQLRAQYLNAFSFFNNR